MTRWTIAACGLCVAAAASLAGCNQTPKPAPAPLTKVTFVTDWKAEAEHGGYYEAIAEGLYKKHGLDVTLIQGGPSVNVPQMIAGGAADFGIGSNAFIVMNTAVQNAPMKAVMAVFQKDPQVLITHPRDDVKSLADMKGKPIMVSDATVSSMWEWLKSKYNFDDKQIRKYTFNLAPFLADPKAIQEGYVTSEPYSIEKEGGFKPQVFLLADDGYSGYANMVLANDKWIEQNPAVVQAFVDASIEGWRDFLFGDPKPGEDLIKKDNPEMTDDVISQAIDKMKSYGLVMSGDATTLGIGAMNEDRWMDFYNTMAYQHVFPIDVAWHDAFTLQFVNKAHGLPLPTTPAATTSSAPAATPSAPATP
jgi:NitT/TauT family transport system substrate-binding protein